MRFTSAGIAGALERIKDEVTSWPGVSAEPLFRPCRVRLATVLALIVVSAGLSMISPFLLRGVLDTAIPHGDTTLLSWLVGGMIAISVVTGVISVGQTWISNSVGQRVMH